MLGTLRDQLSYPETKKGAQGIDDEMLRRLLKKVDLEYLVDRWPQGPNDDKEVDWEQVLSMGEKQRLAMARLFYHKPKFAILDECSSGVSAAMEKRMYETCIEEGVTFITISHRPVLEQYHHIVLNVKKDGKVDGRRGLPRGERATAHQAQAQDTLNGEGSPRTT